MGNGQWKMENGEWTIDLDQEAAIAINNDNDTNPVNLLIKQILMLTNGATV